MIKLLVIYLVLISSLIARENPFFPSSDDADISFSTNEVNIVEPLKRATVTLPSTARVLQSVTITYKNLDGSIVSHKEVLGNSVDWHLPIFISQNIGGNEKKIRVKSRSNASKKKKRFQKLASLSFISLYSDKKNFQLVTKDKLLRNFLLTKPHRIVCDFEREIDIRSYEKTIPKQHRIKKIRLGNHKGYYRVVIELDGLYRYKKTKIKDAYLFTLL